MSVTNFAVVKSRWLRGGLDGGGLDGREESASMLMSGTNQQCCMGFLAEACGIPPGALLLQAYFSSHRIAPFDHLLPPRLAPTGGERSHGPLASAIYSANDSPNITDAEREATLTRLFGEAGIDVEFVP